MLDVIPLNNLAATEKEGRKTIFRIMNNSRFSFPHYSTLGAPVCNCCCYMALVYMYVYILYKRMLSQHNKVIQNLAVSRLVMMHHQRMHSSELRSLCLMKCSNVSKLPILWLTKIEVLYLLFVLFLSIYFLFLKSKNQAAQWVILEQKVQNIHWVFDCSNLVVGT